MDHDLKLLQGGAGIGRASQQLQTTARSKARHGNDRQWQNAQRDARNLHLPNLHCLNAGRATHRPGMLAHDDHPSYSLITPRNVRYTFRFAA